VFICEGFDRFTREPVRIAQQLFLSLINGDPDKGIVGLEVVTLIDGKRYSADSIDRNVGELYTSIALMLGAHMESRNKGDRIREGWNAPNGRRNGGIGKKTGVANGIYPAWITKTKDGPELDKAKQNIIKRIFRMILTMGTMEIAKRLNAEGVPTLTSRKCRRGFNAWQHASISALIRGKQVLGLQPVGRIDHDGKRVLTGEVNPAYPAAVDADEWNAANAAIDARQRGTDTGRNRTSYANLFGPLAVCGECGGRMVIRGKGSYSRRKYFGCCNSGDGQNACRNTKYFRVDQADAGTFRLIGAIPMRYPSDQTLTEGNELEVQLATAERDADELQRTIDQLAATFGNAPSAIKASMLKLAGQHAEKEASVTALKRRLATLRSYNPSEQLAEAKLAVPRGAGKVTVEHRRQVAALLPRLFREFRFGNTVTATLIDGRTYQLGEFMPAGPIALHLDEYKHHLRRPPPASNTNSLRARGHCGPSPGACHAGHFLSLAAPPVLHLSNWTG